MTMNRRQFGLTALASAAMVAAPSVLRAQNTYEVIDVPAGRSLQASWAALQGRSLLSNEYVTMRLGPGAHQLDRLFAPEHDDGKRITIEGSNDTRLEWINTTGCWLIRC